MRIITYSQQDAEIAEACFDTMKLAMGVVFDPEMFEVQSERDFVTERVARAFTMSLLSREIQPSTIESVEVPRTWWDHLKKRLGMKHRTSTIATVVKHYEVYLNRDDALERVKK